MRKRRLAIIAGTIVLALAGTLVAHGVTRTAAAPQAQAMPRCQNIQLAITPYLNSGAAGHVGVIYRLHKLWGPACYLNGYPGMELLDRSFASLPNPVHWGSNVVVGNQTPRRVILDGSHDAYFAVGYGDVPVSGGTCGRASYVMVIPPYDFLPDVTYISRNMGALQVCGTFSASPVESTPSFR